VDGRGSEEPRGETGKEVTEGERSEEKSARDLADHARLSDALEDPAGGVGDEE